MEGKNAPAKAATNQETATLTENSTGKHVELPIIERHDRSQGHRHPPALRRDRLFHLRPGLHLDRQLPIARSPISTATRASCSIAATRSRSWPRTAISARSATSSSTASCRPPTEKKKFEWDITHHTMVHEQLSAFFRGFRRDAHPMAVMCGVVGALSAFYHDSTDIHDPRQRMVASYRLIAKMPTIAAMAYKYSVGQPFVYPQELARLRRELPAHDVRGAVRGV